MDLLFNTETICDNDLDRLRSHRFLCACVKNVLHRASKYHKHDLYVKNMFSRWAILGSVSQVVEISTLLGGPSRRTLAYACQPSVPVLGYMNKENLRAHMLEFKTHLAERLPVGTRCSDIPCILSTDATAVTGRVGVRSVSNVKGDTLSHEIKM